MEVRHQWHCERCGAVRRVKALNERERCFEVHEQNNENLDEFGSSVYIRTINGHGDMIYDGTTQDSLTAFLVDEEVDLDADDETQQESMRERNRQIH